MIFEFRKSSYSGGGGSGTCVEVALNIPATCAIRDSKNPTATPLIFSRRHFATFLEGLKHNTLTS
ncbi:DUF397 domain-containing protein [Saccharopolyspora sp. NPDC002578]